MKKRKTMVIKAADWVEALDRFFPDHAADFGVLKPVKRPPPSPQVKAIMVGLWQSGKFHSV